MKRVYICEDTMTSMLSALYDAWKESRDKEAGIELRGCLSQQLFCEYAEVLENETKAQAVAKLIQRHMGYHTYWDVCQALLSEEEDKADAVFHMMQVARGLQDSRKVMEHLTDPSVAKVFELSRRVGNEAHLFIEFIRFRELENGVLFSEILPKNRVLTCIGDHFTDRFPLENWMVYDKTHQEFLIHHAGKGWFLAFGGELDQEMVNRVSKGENEFSELWKDFFETIAIWERKNPVCQRNHLPLRFRADMTEFSSVDP